MQLIRKRTSIPVPEVYGFSTSLENALGCPYIFMSFIPGIPLYDVWFNPDASDTVITRNRTRALEQIAAAMLQLDQFCFSLGGRIRFEPNTDEPKDIGCYAGNHDEVRFETGPFRHTREFYTCILDRYPYTSTDENRENAPFLHGREKLLQIFIDCIMGLEENNNSFVLTHPDFGLQNFIMSPQGDLLAIIDWDNVVAAPKSLGNKRYPSWLTRDWDPVMYGFEDGELAPGVANEDSPDTLKQYRTVYREFMASDSKETQHFETSATLITENIEIACSNSGLRTSILQKIVKEIADIVDLPEDISVYEICEDLGENKLGKDVQDALCKGFNILLRSTSL